MTEIPFLAIFLYLKIEEEVGPPQCAQQERNWRDQHNSTWSFIDRRYHMRLGRHACECCCWWWLGHSLLYNAIVTRFLAGRQFQRRQIITPPVWSAPHWWWPLPIYQEWIWYHLTLQWGERHYGRWIWVVFFGGCPNVSMFSIWDNRLVYHYSSGLCWVQ